jgi:hypothetical protein
MPFLPILPASHHVSRCLMAVTPSLQSLWLADDVTTDSQTGKVTAQGIFDEIEIKRPATQFDSPASLFFGLIGMHGNADFQLCYVDLSNNEVLMERAVRVECSDPLSVTGVQVRLPKMPVPHPGIYTWELYCGGELLGCTRITAHVV